MRITMVVVLILTCVTSLRSQESSLPPGSAGYTTAPVGLRVQPRPTARLVTRLEPGTALQVATCSKGWCSVKAGAISGHILSEYIGREPPTRRQALGYTTILVAVLTPLERVTELTSHLVQVPKVEIGSSERFYKRNKHNY